jgi:hypothetical protein
MDRLARSRLGRVMCCTPFAYFAVRGAWAGTGMALCVRSLTELIGPRPQALWMSKQNSVGPAFPSQSLLH